MADRLFLVFYIFLPPAALIVILLMSYFNNRFVNDHPDRQWIAIRNTFRPSQIEFVKNRVEYRWWWWKKDTIVLLNKEDATTPDGGHTASTKTGGKVRVAARYNILTGREFNRANGQLERDPADPHKIEPKNDFVLLAITKTKFADREKYVADVLSATIDFVIGQYSYDELMAPGEQDDEGVWIPARDLLERSGDPYTLERKWVKNKGDLLKPLAAYMEREANFRLRDVGFNVDEVQLSALEPGDSKVQDDLDRAQRMKSRKRAMEEYAGMNLTDREKLGDIEDLPQLAAAEAQMRLAEALATAATKLAEGSTSAAEKLADGFVKGMSNFGKGS